LWKTTYAVVVVVFVEDLYMRHQIGNGRRRCSSCCCCRFCCNIWEESHQPAFPIELMLFYCCSWLTGIDQPSCATAGGYELNETGKWIIMSPLLFAIFFPFGHRKDYKVELLPFFFSLQFMNFALSCSHAHFVALVC
jgi:hypothetical protein